MRRPREAAAQQATTTPTTRAAVAVLRAARDSDGIEATRAAPPYAAVASGGRRLCRQFYGKLVIFTKGFTVSCL
jgi:hypothetical protein